MRAIGKYMKLSSTMIFRVRNNVLNKAMMKSKGYFLVSRDLILRQTV